jgi:neutral trehalase
MFLTLHPCIWTVIAGDRFRETYYWDSYWVLRGLLVSGMTQTAAGLVGNLLAMLEAVGHVPNGARVYYLNRRCVGSSGFCEIDVGFRVSD